LRYQQKTIARKFEDGRTKLHEQKSQQDSFVMNFLHIMTNNADLPIKMQTTVATYLQTIHPQQSVQCTESIKKGLKLLFNI